MSSTWYLTASAQLITLNFYSCFWGNYWFLRQFYNAHWREAPLYTVRDKVWLNGQKITMTCLMKKLDHKWLSPYPVEKVISHNTYWLKLPSYFSQIHCLLNHPLKTLQHRCYLWMCSTRPTPTHSPQQSQRIQSRTHPGQKKIQRETWTPGMLERIWHWRGQMETSWGCQRHCSA